MSDRIGGASTMRGADLRVVYGNAIAVDGVDISVPSGKITALLGPNGAGKTSTLMALYGAVAASGQVQVDEQDVTGLSSAGRRALGVVLMPQGRQLFSSMTVEDNLRVVADLNRLGRDSVERGLRCFAVLAERRRATADVLSGGQQRMLGLARAIMVSPSVLLLDESVDGLSVGTVRELMATVHELAASGVSVLMAEPTAGPILEWIDRGYVMLRGRIRGVAESAADLERLYEEQLGLADAPIIAGTTHVAAAPRPTTKGNDR